LQAEQTAWCDVRQSAAAATHICEVNDSSDSSDSQDENTDDSITPKELKPENIRVLIVDDSFICQKLLTRGLTKAKFQTATAANGQEACDMLRSVPCLYDAVLMDLRMPVMDGIEATAYCRDDLHLQLPIIVVSAELDSSVQEAAMQVGATAFIPKPAKISAIIDLLKSNLGMMQTLHQI
jgi:CheY-like chemotaxis protein